MENLVIQIGWPQFIGVIVTISGSLILIAWKSGGRFTGIETSITWIKESITKLEGRMDNAFGSASPIKLLPRGIEILEKSGLKEYIDKNRDDLISRCGFKKDLTNQYDIQENAFRCFDELDFGEFESKLKETSYKYGMSLETIRRIGGIHFRDILLSENGFTPEDLDKPKDNQK